MNKTATSGLCAISFVTTMTQITSRSKLEVSVRWVRVFTPFRRTRHQSCTGSSLGTPPVKLCHLDARQPPLPRPPQTHRPHLTVHLPLFLRLPLLPYPAHLFPHRDTAMVALRPLTPTLTDDRALLSLLPLVPRSVGVRLSVAYQRTLSRSKTSGMTKAPVKTASWRLRHKSLFIQRIPHSIELFGR